MIGLVVATHGNLGEALLETLAMIIGPADLARAVSLSRNHSPELLQDQLAAAIAAVNQGQGVLVAADMFGGTPANVCLTLLEPGRVELLTGVNLPMLIKFFAYRERLALPELADLLQGYARDGIVQGSTVLSRQP
jgi:PTS system mannose-specific IIA component